VSESANIANTAAIPKTGTRALANLSPRQIMRPNNAKAARRLPRPILPGGRNPYRGTLVVVFTFMVVLAAPLVVARVPDPKVQVMPGTDEQDKVTLLVKPPAGVTVTITGVD
jgi:hypothetical protein